MKRTLFAIASVLLASLFVTSSLMPIGIKAVNANTGSAAFCPNFYWWGLDSTYELWLSREVTGYIADFLEDRYGYCFLMTDEDATVSAYSDVIWTLNVAYDQAVFFSKGHYGTWIGNHRTLCDHYGNDVIDCVDIYPYSSQGFRFVFIWHCVSAQIYPSYQDEYGWVGMPYCWTHNNDMTQYGYGTNQVYLGWYGGSPQLEYEIEDQYPYEEWNYGHFVYLFFEAMYDGYTVYGDLNYLANVIYDETYFCYTSLWFWLMVWGNGGMTLPS